MAARSTAAATCLCVPGSAAADPSPAPSTAFGTGNGPLRYRICVPCSKRPPPVRDAFSEARRTKNPLLRYGRDIRCQKQASVVRDASSKARSARTVAAACVYCGGGAFFKKIKKEDVFLGKVLEYTPSIKLYDLIISPEIWRPVQLQDVR